MKKEPHHLKYSPPAIGINKQGFLIRPFNLPVKGSGVYVIKEHDEIVYIGSSKSCLYKTAFRHFHEWNCKTQYRVTYKHILNDSVFTIGVLLCDPEEAVKIESEWIRKYQPKDNRNGKEDLNHVVNYRRKYSKTRMKNAVASMEETSF